MFYAKALVIAAVIIGSFLLVADAVLAAETTAFPVWKAERAVKAARNDLRRAEQRLAEAKKVLTATRTYTALHGPAVGRWVRCSRRVGWQWSSIPTLMYVIDRESNGDPAVQNYMGSGATGLLQLMPVHWQGRFDPRDPRANLSYGYKLYRGSGWSPWGM